MVYAPVLSMMCVPVECTMPGTAKAVTAQKTVRTAAARAICRIFFVFIAVIVSLSGEHACSSAARIFSDRSGSGRMASYASISLLFFIRLVSPFVFQ